MGLRVNVLSVSASHVFGLPHGIPTALSIWTSLDMISSISLVDDAAYCFATSLAALYSGNVSLLTGKPVFKEDVPSEFDKTLVDFGEFDFSPVGNFQANQARRVQARRLAVQVWAESVWPEEYSAFLNANIDTGALDAAAVTALQKYHLEWNALFPWLSPNLAGQFAARVTSQEMLALWGPAWQPGNNWFANENAAAFPYALPIAAEDFTEWDHVHGGWHALTDPICTKAKLTMLLDPKCGGQILTQPPRTISNTFGSRRTQVTVPATWHTGWIWDMNPLLWLGPALAELAPLAGNIHKGSSTADIFGLSLAVITGALASIRAGKWFSAITPASRVGFRGTRVPSLHELVFDPLPFGLFNSSTPWHPGRAGHCVQGLAKAMGLPAFCSPVNTSVSIRVQAVTPNETLPAKEYTDGAAILSDDFGGEVGYGPTPKLLATLALGFGPLDAPWLRSAVNDSKAVAQAMNHYKTKGDVLPFPHVAWGSWKWTGGQFNDGGAVPYQSGAPSLGTTDRIGCYCPISTVTWCRHWDRVIVAPEVFSLGFPAVAAGAAQWIPWTNQIWPTIEQFVSAQQGIAAYFQKNEPNSALVKSGHPTEARAADLQTLAQAAGVCQLFVLRLQTEPPGGPEYLAESSFGPSSPNVVATSKFHSTAFTNAAAILWLWAESVAAHYGGALPFLTSLKPGAPYWKHNMNFASANEATVDKNARWHALLWAAYMRMFFSPKSMQGLLSQIPLNLHANCRVEFLSPKVWPFESVAPGNAVSTALAIESLNSSASMLTFLAQRIRAYWRKEVKGSLGGGETWQGEIVAILTDRYQRSLALDPNLAPPDMVSSFAFPNSGMP